MLGSCSYPISENKAQCELVPDYYGADHLWLCSFEKPRAPSDAEALAADEESLDDPEGPFQGRYIPLL